MIVSRALCKVGVRKRFQNATNIVFNVIVFGVPFLLFKLSLIRLLVLLQDIQYVVQVLQRYETKVPSEVFLCNPTMWSLELFKTLVSNLVFFFFLLYTVEKY